MNTEPNAGTLIHNPAQRAAFQDLCEAYDSFLHPDHDEAPEGARETLQAFARVFDLPVDDETPVMELWRQVRPALAAQIHADGAPHDPAVAAAPTRIFLSAGVGGARTFGDPAAALSLLVVEDDPDLSVGIVEALTDAGHRVVAVASTAEQAAVLVAQHPIAFAIVDMELGGNASGVDFARQLYDRWGLRTLFMSGAANEGLVNLEMALGFLGKPFSATELLAAVTLAGGLLERERPTG